MIAIKEVKAKHLIILPWEIEKRERKKEKSSDDVREATTTLHPQMLLTTNSGIFPEREGEEAHHQLATLGGLFLPSYMCTPTAHTHP